LAAELLGFEGYISAYATARDQEILQGVNYASAAAGIREETGQQLVPFLFLYAKFCAHNL
jgi:hypothetical protein